MQPYVSEPGVPTVTVNGGTSNPFAGLQSGSGSGSGSGSESSTGGGTSGLTGGNVGGSDALNTLLGTPFGAQAVAAAQALGVNPSALAAMCAMESQCQNIANSSGTSTASGPWQMINSTYNSMIAAAAQADPTLAASFQGKSDPATEAAAASELLQTEAQKLETAGVSDPTVLDVRGGYAFGDTYLAEVAKASDATPLGTILQNWSASTWAANGLTPSTTVGQWRQAITNKIGSAANQSVLM
jgi:hypothetical protein